MLQRTVIGARGANMKRRSLWLILAQFASVAGQNDLLDAPIMQTVMPSPCPLARYDMQANRYLVEPVSERIRAVLELREKVPGSNSCTGPLVGEASDTFSFEAAHFVPARDRWEGVLTAAPERLINSHIGRSQRPVMENAAREGMRDDAETAQAHTGVVRSEGDAMRNEEEDLYEVCVVSSGVCVATLERPPLRSVFDRLGFYTLRDRTPQINAYIYWMCFAVLIFLVVLLVEVLFVHLLLKNLFTTSDSVVSPDLEDVEENSFVEGVVPTSYDVIMQVVVSLGRMAVAASTLIVVCCCFIFKREVEPWDGRIMAGYPLVIMFLHMLVLTGSVFKILLYNSLLRDKVHIVFNDKKAYWFISPLWLCVFASTAVFLYTGLGVLVGDARTGSCIAEAGEHGECSTFQVCVYVGLGFWGLFFPVAYCIFLIFTDFTFENAFMPLYAVFSKDGAIEDPDAPAEFLKGVKPVAYNDFVWAAHRYCQEKGVQGMTAQGVREKVDELKKAVSDGKIEKPSSSTWADLGDGTSWTPRWVAESASFWSWRLRMQHSKNKALELRLLLIVVTTAFAWTVVAAFGASVYRQLCIPGLEEITSSIGQLSPEFDPHVFNYNIFVDTHVKSAGLEVIAEKKFTATTAFRMPSLGSGPQEEPWIKKTKNVHVPFLIRSPMLERNASQSEELRASRRAPVPIELHVRGAGTTLVYRITVVKLETRVAALTYKYNTSSQVDEVVVHKDIDWEKVNPAEEVAAEKEAFADAETEGAAVYVPEDTKEVTIDMQREMAIFGPTGGFVLSGFELAQFEAVRRLLLCPPGRSCTEDSGAVSLEKSVTALPVELKPNGTDPLRFFVSIIRISNRLINLEMEGAMGERASSGGKWAGMPFLPAFRPLVSSYETFFEVPERKAVAGDDEKDDWHTLFLRVLPQGNARSNWLDAELKPNSPGDEEMELFCRPADDSDEPLDPTVEKATEDLSCGAPADEAQQAENGQPTKEMIIRSGDAVFRNHFYLRYKYKLSDPRPFTLIMKVMFHDEVAEAVNTTGIRLPVGHRTYEVKFLPQAPMRLDLFAPLSPPTPPAKESAADGALLAMNTNSKRRFRLRSKDRLDATQFGLPLFLSPPFSSNVLVYDALVPEGSTGSLLLRMTGSHSLWVGSGDEPLEGLGRGAGVRQELALRRGPDCSADASSPGIGPLCPVSVRIFERRDGFPRSYQLHMREAPVDSVLFVGMLSYVGDSARAAPLPGFRPEARRTNSTFQKQEWRWVQQSAAPAAAPSPATPAVAGDAPAGVETTGADAKAADKTAKPGGDAAAGQEPAAPAKTDSPTDAEAKPAPTEAPGPTQEEVDKQAQKDLASIVNPVSPTVQPVPRQEAPEPTNAPRKVDEPLLPFFLQTASDTGAPPAEDDSAPLFTTLFRSGAAPSPAAATEAPTEEAPTEEAPTEAAPTEAAKEEEKPTTPKPTSPPADAKAWVSGEPMPTSPLAILAGSSKTELNVQWNGMALEVTHKGPWWEVEMAGRMLAEACWCDRKQLGHSCKSDLRSKAPAAAKKYYRRNRCLLHVKAGGKLLHEISVGAAGAASPALQERAMQEAADATPDKVIR